MARSIDQISKRGSTWRTSWGHHIHRTLSKVVLRFQIKDQFYFMCTMAHPNDKLQSASSYTYPLTNSLLGNALTPLRIAGVVWGPPRPHLPWSGGRHHVVLRHHLLPGPGVRHPADLHQLLLRGQPCNTRGLSPKWVTIVASVYVGLQCSLRLYGLSFWPSKQDTPNCNVP